MVGPLCFQLDQEIHGVSQESARISDAKKKHLSRLFYVQQNIRCHTMPYDAGRQTPSLHCSPRTWACKSLSWMIVRNRRSASRRTHSIGSEPHVVGFSPIPTLILQAPCVAQVSDCHVRDAATDSSAAFIWQEKEKEAAALP